MGVDVSRVDAMGVDFLRGDIMALIPARYVTGYFLTSCLFFSE